MTLVTWDVSTINYLRIFGRGVSILRGIEAEFYDFVKVCEIYGKNKPSPQSFPESLGGWFNHAFKDSTSYPPRTKNMEPT